ncbi:hypothetical protein RCL1_002936 [Eukaryota sp. TZLM3-RCL]
MNTVLSLTQDTFSAVSSASFVVSQLSSLSSNASIDSKTLNKWLNVIKTLMHDSSPSGRICGCVFLSNSLHFIPLDMIFANLQHWFAHISSCLQFPSAEVVTASVTILIKLVLLNVPSLEKELSTFFTPSFIGLLFDAVVAFPVSKCFKSMSLLVSLLPKLFKSQQNLSKMIELSSCLSVNLAIDYSNLLINLAIQNNYVSQLFTDFIKSIQVYCALLGIGTVQNNQSINLIGNNVAINPKLIGNSRVPFTIYLNSLEFVCDCFFNCLYSSPFPFDYDLIVSLLKHLLQELAIKLNDYSHANQFVLAILTKFLAQISSILGPRCGIFNPVVELLHLIVELLPEIPSNLIENLKYFNSCLPSFSALVVSPILVKFNSNLTDQSITPAIAESLTIIYNHCLKELAKINYNSLLPRSIFGFINRYPDLLASLFNYHNVCQSINQNFDLKISQKITMIVHPFVPVFQKQSEILYSDTLLIRNQSNLIEEVKNPGHSVVEPVYEPEPMQSEISIKNFVQITEKPKEETLKPANLFISQTNSNQNSEENIGSNNLDDFEFCSDGPDSD